MFSDFFGGYPRRYGLILRCAEKALSGVTDSVLDIGSDITLSPSECHSVDVCRRFLLIVGKLVLGNKKTAVIGGVIVIVNHSISLSSAILAVS